MCGLKINITIEKTEVIGVTKVFDQLVDKNARYERDLRARIGTEKHHFEN